MKVGLQISEFSFIIGIFLPTKYLYPVWLLFNSKLGEYPAALSLYAELGDLGSLHDMCQMGLAFYKSQKYTESYQGLYKGRIVYA